MYLIHWLSKQTLKICLVVNSRISGGVLSVLLVWCINKRIANLTTLVWRQDLSHDKLVLEECLIELTLDVSVLLDLRVQHHGDVVDLFLKFFVFLLKIDNIRLHNVELSLLLLTAFLGGLAVLDQSFELLVLTFVRVFIIICTILSWLFVKVAKLLCEGILADREFALAKDRGIVSVIWANSGFSFLDSNTAHIG